MNEVKTNRAKSSTSPGSRASIFSEKAAILWRRNTSRHQTHGSDWTLLNRCWTSRARTGIELNHMNSNRDIKKPWIPLKFLSLFWNGCFPDPSAQVSVRSNAFTVGSTWRCTRALGAMEDHGDRGVIGFGGCGLWISWDIMEPLCRIGYELAGIIARTWG